MSILYASGFGITGQTGLNLMPVIAGIASRVLTMMTVFRWAFCID
jgi:hypothetical protein